MDERVVNSIGMARFEKFTSPLSACIAATKHDVPHNYSMPIFTFASV